MMFDFANQVAIVTGAAGILGQVVGRQFLAAKAHVVLVDRETERLAALFPDLQGSDEHWLATSVDLLDEANVQAMVKEVLKRFGRIDVLANCVGGFRGGAVNAEDSLQTWDFMFDLNARTAFIVSRAVLSPMLEQKRGKIVHIASSAGLQAGTRRAAYSASKSAVIRLTEGLSAEVKGSGINVNCVLPKTIDTPDNRQSMPNAKFDRWVSPENIASVILFLSSSDACAIHGAAIPVYGTG
jgi:NAD(P)-dependent dehydrogenase (short-subunit alcohol dehydrogenase family)